MVEVEDVSDEGDTKVFRCAILQKHDGDGNGDGDGNYGKGDGHGDNDRDGDNDEMAMEMGMAMVMVMAYLCWLMMRAVFASFVLRSANKSGCIRSKTRR